MIDIQLFTRRPSNAIFCTPPKQVMKLNMRINARRRMKNNAKPGMKRNMSSNVRLLTSRNAPPAMKLGIKQSTRTNAKPAMNRSVKPLTKRNVKPRKINFFYNTSSSKNIAYFSQLERSRTSWNIASFTTIFTI